MIDQPSHRQQQPGMLSCNHLAQMVLLALSLVCQSSAGNLAGYRVFGEGGAAMCLSYIPTILYPCIRSNDLWRQCGIQFQHLAGFAYSYSHGQNHSNTFLIQQPILLHILLLY
ncbi:hypothetical protein Tsubulata_019728 [Turnera subulata]|uniref:Uncharacterized protein n=1 Tax=Turnera subulata TaxID=218843 RepID=A0A9Q0GE17_9ROSI|nr:hypothetical protein Tsubulata_019728 [Turnera subulata]